VGKKIAGVVFRLVVSVGIIIYIFSNPDINLDQTFATIRSIKLPWLIAALFTYKAALLIGSRRWQLLMKTHNMQVSYPVALGLNYLGCFFNNFMLSLTGGDIVKAYYASKMTSSKKAEAATIVFLDRLIGFSGLLILGVAGVLFGAGNERMHSAMIIVCGVILIFVVLGFFAFNKNFARKLGKYFMGRKVGETLRKVYNAVYFYKSSKSMLVRALVFSVIVWTLLILVNFQLARGLGMELRAGYFFAFIPVINIISSIPITIAGWGLREQMYKQFFCPVGVDGEIAVSLSIAYALIMLLWSLVGGVLYALHLPRLTTQGGGKND